MVSKPAGGDLGEILKKPFLDIGKFLTGTVLGLIPILNFVILGYGVDNARSPKTLPGFEMRQLVLGAKLFLTGLVYMIVPLTVIGVGIYYYRFDLSIGGMLLTAAMLPVITRASLQVAKSNSITDGLRAIDMLKAAYTRPFLGAWIGASVLSFGVSFVLSLIPLVGGVLAAFPATVIFWTFIGFKVKI